MLTWVDNVYDSACFSEVNLMLFSISYSNINPSDKYCIVFLLECWTCLREIYVFYAISNGIVIVYSYPEPNANHNKEYIRRCISEDLQGDVVIFKTNCDRYSWLWWQICMATYCILERHVWLNECLSVLLTVGIFCVLCICHVHLHVAVVSTPTELRICCPKFEYWEVDAQFTHLFIIPI